MHELRSDIRNHVQHHKTGPIPQSFPVTNRARLSGTSKEEREKEERVGRNAQYHINHRTYLSDVLRLETAAGLPFGHGGQLEPGRRETPPYEGERLPRVRGVFVGPPGVI